MYAHIPVHRDVSDCRNVCSKTRRWQILGAVVLLFAVASVAGCAAGVERSTDTATSQESEPHIDQAVASEPVWQPATHTALQRPESAVSSIISPRMTASDQSEDTTTGKAAASNTDSGPTVGTLSTKTESMISSTPTKDARPEAALHAGPATITANAPEEKGMLSDSKKEKSNVAATATEPFAEDCPEYEVSDVPLVEGDMLILVPTSAGSMPEPALGEIEDEPIGGIMQPVPEQEELPDVGTVFEEGKEDTVTETLKGLVGRWEQIAGGNQPDFVEGGYRKAELEFKPGGRLVVRLRYDEDGTFELVRRTDYRIDKSGKIRLGENKPFGESVLIEDKLTITMNKRGGKIVILPAVVALPIDLTISVQGNEMTLGNKQYVRR